MKSKIPSVDELIRKNSKARYVMVNDDRFGTRKAKDSHWLAQEARLQMVKQYA